jgi:hypothetical protein
METNGNKKIESYSNESVIELRLNSPVLPFVASPQLSVVPTCLVSHLVWYTSFIATQHRHHFGYVFMIIHHCLLLFSLCALLLTVFVLCVLSSYVYLIYYVFVYLLYLLFYSRSQYPEGPATGHLDTGFSLFPCVYKRMLRWFPSFQVATTCCSCSPPHLNFLVTYSLRVK